jgi:hypothetical protein
VYCGDDESTQVVVARLIRDVNLDPVDASPLSITRNAEPFALVVAQLAYKGKGLECGVSFRAVGESATRPELALPDGQTLAWELFLAGDFKVFEHVPSAFAGLSAAD